MKSRLRVAFLLLLPIVRLIPPAYVKPYVKRQKNDAEAVCESVTRSNMRFVPTKQSGMVLHRARHLCMRQQISVINAIRAHLAEFGIVAAVGGNGVEELLDMVADPSDKRDAHEQERKKGLFFSSRWRLSRSSWRAGLRKMHSGS